MMALHADTQDARALLGDGQGLDPEVQQQAGWPPTNSRSRASRAAWVVVVCFVAGALASLAFVSGAAGGGTRPQPTVEHEAIETKSEHKAKIEHERPLDQLTDEELLAKVKALQASSAAQQTTSIAVQQATTTKAADTVVVKLTGKKGELNDIAEAGGCGGPSACKWANSKSCSEDSDDGTPCWLLCCAGVIKPCKVTANKLGKIEDELAKGDLIQILHQRNLLDGPAPNTFKPCELAAAHELAGTNGTGKLLQKASEKKGDGVEDDASLQCKDCSWSKGQGACAAANNDGSDCWEICCKMVRAMLQHKTTTKPPPPPPFSVASMFGSHMVLPAGKGVKLFGWVKKVDSRSIVVKYRGEDYYAKPDYNTRLWEVMLPPAEMSLEPVEIVVTLEDEDSIVLTDVLFGELYVCVGASNVDFRLDWSTDARKALKETKNFGNRVRITKVKRQEGKEPEDTFTPKFAWQRAKDDDNTAEFSALCYFYGLEQIKRRQDTPVGLVQASWGATAAWQWTPRGAMIDCEAELDEDAGHGDFWEPRSSSVLWHGMMHPWSALQVKGLILNLQGDRCILPMTIRHWRQAWLEKGNDEPAVVAAQFGCNTGEKGNPTEITDARIDQMHFLEADRVALAVTSDFCDPASPYAIMHSPFKREEAARLAEAGEAVTQDIVDIPQAFPVPMAVYADPWDESWGHGAHGSDKCRARSWGIRVEFDQELLVKTEFKTLHKKFAFINGFTLYPAVEATGWEFPVKLSLTEIRKNVVVLNTTLMMTDLDAKEPWPGTLMYGDGAFPILPLTNKVGQPVGSFKVGVPQEADFRGDYSLFSYGPWSPVQTAARALGRWK